MRTILRVRKDTGEIFILDRNGRGQFEIGDPSFASEKSHPRRRFGVETIEEVIELVGKGYSVRLRGLDSEDFNMISSKDLRIVEIPE
jgi:hypothetical protein